jgi:hypothetical protein
MKATITIPTSLSEITLGQYQNFRKVAEGLEGDALAHRTVNILCDVRLSDVMMLRLVDVRQIATDINKLFTTEQPLKPTFKIQAKDSEVHLNLGFIPSLDDISGGEYMDLDRYINDWETMHNAMSVLYRPITKQAGDKYLIADYVGSKGDIEFPTDTPMSDLIRYMPLDIALGAVVFFYRLGNELLQTTQRYLVEQTKELISLPQHNSTENGDGTTPSIHSLKETLEHLTKLPKFELPQLLHF